MAAIALSATTVRKIAPGPGEVQAWLVVTPATADSGDTVDVSGTPVNIKDIKFLTVWDETSGDVVTATESAGVITIDTAGGTSNHTYGIYVIGYNPA